MTVQFSPLPAYAELHCLSNFSFLRGASHPAELVARAGVLGYAALAITDECSLAGVVRAHEAAKSANLPLIIGSEFRLADGPGLVLLATSRSSYGGLCSLITRARMRAPKGCYELRRADIEAAAADGLRGCLALLTARTQDGHRDACWVGDCFPGRSWIAAELLATGNDRTRLAGLRELSRASGLPLVATGDVHMHVRSRRRLQDVLTAIRLGKPVHACGHALFPNGERHLRHRLRLGRVYPPELLAESVHIAGLCRFSLDELRYEYPEELVPPGQTPDSHLRNLAIAGLARRYPGGVPPAVQAMVERELGLIAELRYPAFFLTVHDLVCHARAKGILCQGRGSAANSAVCFALGITEVDPARQQLLFERFISRERNEPPDIDVDFEHQRREEVIQYIYGKYGRERAALAATVICYRRKSALRDVGRALDLDRHQLDKLCRSLAWWDKPEELPERLMEAGMDGRSRVVRQLLEFAMTLYGFPRHLSQHVGGFVIANGPLSELVPVENAAMAGRSVIQWDKDDLDALGLLKVDVLALGMLTVIRKTLEMVSRRRGSRLEMADILAAGDDPAVYDMICAADTVGVFQIESRAQMSMLPRLKPRCFYDLVVEVAIVRPGPIQGDMVHPYLQRRAQGTEPAYPSQAVRKVLARTLGVPIFQEQVMELAVEAAGFSPGEADQLRRSMAAWKRKGGLQPYEKRLKEGMEKNGYPAQFADRLYRQIMGFGEYGFPESHAASFALLAYVSAWLKHHEPAAFLAGLLNSQPMGFYAPAQLIQDARRHDVAVLPVDVCCSGAESGLEGAAVRLGLDLVMGLGKDPAARLIQARAAGPFVSVDDLARRAALGHRDLDLLASAGALHTLAGHRRHAWWQATGIETAPGLLQHAPVAETSPALAAPCEAQDLVADYRSLGFTLGRHPLALLRPRLRGMRFLQAKELETHPANRRVRLAGLVIGRQRPGTASGTIFVTLEDETGHCNVIVWPDLGERQRAELLCARLLGVEGLLERQGQVIHLIARQLWDHSAWLRALPTRSRDFH